MITPLPNLSITFTPTQIITVSHCYYSCYIAISVA